MWLFALLGVAPAEEVEDRNARLVQRKPRATAILLDEIMADADAAQQHQLRYWMARSFERIELFHAAQRYHLAVIAAGPGPWRDASLVSLVELTDTIGDDADLIAALSAIPAAEFPARVASSLHYLKGVGQQERGDVAGAHQSWQAVPYGTPRYFQARHRLAVLLAETEQPAAARDVLVDLIQVRPYGTRLQQQDAKQIQDLALVNLARLYYGSGRYDEAGRLYAQVRTRSPWSAVAQLEGGWASLMTGRPTAAMAEGQAAAEGAFLPEGELLAASAVLQSSGCPAALPRLEGFLAVHRPMAAELVRIEGMDGAELWEWWFGEEVTAERALPAAFFSRLLSDQPLAGAIYRMDRIAQERWMASQQPADWLDSVGSGVISLLTADHATVTTRMHARLSERADVLGAELRSLVGEAEALMVACAAEP